MIRALAWGGSSAGRASRSQCEGREFDPPPLHQTNTRSPLHAAQTLAWCGVFRLQGGVSGSRTRVAAWSDPSDDSSERPFSWIEMRNHKRERRSEGKGKQSSDV